jgi:uncharacterized repeat protein (TIGR01451 family)
VVSTYPISVAFNTWRNSPAFIGAILVSADLPPNLMGNYHLSQSSPAANVGASGKLLPAYQGVGTLAAPSIDIDNQSRPSQGAYDIGADELPAPTANLGIAITDGLSTVNAGQAISYTITVTNGGPNAVTGATVADSLPAVLTGATWTCAPAANCGAASGIGNLATTVNLANGQAATLVVNATVSPSASGNLVNTATVTAPAGVTDPALANNSATDTTLIVQPLPLPTLTVLDNFDRANANTLGASWSQVVVPILGGSLRVNTNQASAALLGWAMWNATGNVFGPKQGAAFTFVNTPASGSYLILKASGGSASTPANYIRVNYIGSGVTVSTTTNSGGNYALRATFPTTFSVGDTLSATADATGTVAVWKTSGATITFLGSVTIPTSGAGSWTQGAGGGRIGLNLPTGARVDNFSGATLP